jgi:hypothetical protein
MRGHRRRTWFSNPRWALSGGGALAAALVLVFLSRNHEQILRDAPVPGKRITDASEVILPPAAQPADESAAGRAASATEDAPEREHGVLGAEPASPPSAPAPSQELGAAKARKPVTASNEAPKKEADVRGGRQNEASDLVQQVQRAEESARAQSTAPTLNEARSLPAPAPPPVPAARAEANTAARFLSTAAPEVSWKSGVETDLQKAVADQDADALRQILEVIESHRAAEDAASPDAASLGLSLRARCELQRLAPGDTSPCDAIRADYASWQEQADAALQNSPEGLRLRDLVQEVCPE